MNGSLGEILKTQRKKLGLTQKEAAESTGVSLKTYADYENNNKKPLTKATYLLLAQALKCNVESLIKYDNRFNKNMVKSSSLAGIAASAGIAGIMPIVGPIIAPSIILGGALLSKQVNKNVLENEYGDNLKEDEFTKKLSAAQRQFKALSTGLICSILSSKSISFSIHETEFYDLTLTLEDQFITRWCFDFWSDNIDTESNEFISLDIKARMVLSKYMLQAKNKHRKVSVIVDNKDLFEALLVYKNKNSYQGHLSIILIDTEKVKIVNEEYLAYYSEEYNDKLPILC